MMITDDRDSGGQWGAATQTRGFTPTIVAKPETAPPPPQAPRVPPPEAPRQAEAFNRALLRVVADLVFLVRHDGLVDDFFPPEEGEVPIGPQQVVHRRLAELLPSQIAQLAMHYLERVCRTGTAQSFTCQYNLPGRMRIFEARLAPCGPAHVLALVRDVTDRQTLENEMIENSHRVQMRVGQDLHDSLGQHLTGISFLSRALEKTLAAKELPEAAEAAEISKLVLQAISQTRHLARGLFPAELENRGLLPALQELANNVEELCRISCSLECDGQVAVVRPDAAMHLFRLAQEAVNNAVKHGRPKRIVIGLGTGNGKTVLSVQDDGVGIPANRQHHKGLGLRIMAYRAQKIGAVLDVRPGTDGGTLVTCAFETAQPIE